MSLLQFIQPQVFSDAFFLKKITVSDEQKDPLKMEIMVGYCSELVSIGERNLLVNHYTTTKKQTVRQFAPKNDNF